MAHREPFPIPATLLPTLSPMKSFLFTAVALLLTAPAAHAGEILPNLYAKHYCDLRAIGVNTEDAVSAAVYKSYIRSGYSPKVRLADGREIDADVVQAHLAAKQRCPQYFSGSPAAQPRLVPTFSDAYRTGI